MALYPERRFNELSLCTGYHGIGLGLRFVEPRHRTVCMVERELFAAANMAQKMRFGILDEAPVWDNLESFDGKPWSGKVDVVTGGIPCQPWSVAGQKKKTEDDRWIWEDVHRIVREIRPKFVFLEEVPGFIRGGLGYVYRDLTEVGYCVTHDCFRASDLGAPHQRERVFVLAQLDDTGYSELPPGRPSEEGSIQQSRDEFSSSSGDSLRRGGEELVDAAGEG